MASRQFNSDQLDPMSLRTDVLPLNKDVINHVAYLREKGLPTKDAIQKTVILLRQIWTEADCPPLSRSNVEIRLEKLVQQFFRGLRTRGDQVSEKKYLLCYLVGMDRGSLGYTTIVSC